MTVSAYHIEELKEYNERNEVIKIPYPMGNYQYHIFSPYRVCPLGAHVDHQHGLVTGAAGFIGSNLVKRLFHDVKDIRVIGIDLMTDYYDVNIKKERLYEIKSLNRDWVFVEDSIANRDAVEKIFTTYKPAVVVNLAAQAGVRYSITNPDAYIQSNMIGFYNLLEACRHHEVEHMVYASSSSVYGLNNEIPYSTDDKVDNPVSLYAATKKSN